MIVHLHCTCWNEERMLPFFFRHYDSLVDHYFIHDNFSTDGSLDILRSHPRVTVVPLVLTGDSYIESASAQANQFWHPSRGAADWVAVCNIDELFWHIDLRWYLKQCRETGITFLQARGFQMVSEEFPDPDADLARDCRFGARAKRYDKPAFFNPDAIAESGFARGRHSCKPKGRVIRPLCNEILLLHYKNLGLSYVRQRHRELNARRRSLDIEHGLGRHYDTQMTDDEFMKFYNNRREVLPAYTGSLRRAKRRFFGPVVRPEVTK